MVKEQVNLQRAFSSAHLWIVDEMKNAGKGAVLTVSFPPDEPDRNPEESVVEKFTRVLNKLDQAADDNYLRYAFLGAVQQDIEFPTMYLAVDDDGSEKMFRVLQSALAEERGTYVLQKVSYG